MSLSIRTPSHASTLAPAAGPPVLWLALLAAPIALSANSPVLVLPSIAAEGHVSVATATWVVTAFGWAMSVGTPLMASLLRRRGMRTAVWTSASLIAVGTALVAVSPWLPLVAGGRAAQAAGGAGLVTVAMSLAGSARRMGVITAGFGVLGAVGPLLGSLNADWLSWHLSLSVSALALLAVPAVLRRMDTSGPQPSAPFDVRGASLLVATASALVLLPRYTLPAASAALLAAALLALHIRRNPSGFVPLAVIRTRVFVLASVTVMALSTSYFTLLFAIPQLLRDRTDWSTSTVGTGQLVALAIGSTLSWFLVAASVRMHRSRVLALLLTLGSLAPLAVALAPWPSLLLPVAAVAVFTATAGNGTLAVQAFASVPAPERPTAVGLFNLCYQLGGAFGPALAAVLTLTR